MPRVKKNSELPERSDYSKEIRKYFSEQVQLRIDDIRAASNDVNDIIKYIVQSIHSQDQRFKGDVIKVGSYWQGLKVTDPDEFDISVAMDTPKLNWTARKPPFKFR